MKKELIKIYKEALDIYKEAIVIKDIDNDMFKHYLKIAFDKLYYITREIEGFNQLQPFRANVYKNTAVIAIELEYYQTARWLLKEGLNGNTNKNKAKEMQELYDNCSLKAFDFHLN